MQAEQLTPVITRHGEGPVWDSEQGALRLVDMLDGDVVTLRLDGTHERESFGSVAAVWRPRRDGGAVVAVERGFCLVDADGSRALLPDVVHEPGERMNEGGCDPQGRFYCGSMTEDSTPRAALFRLDPDRSVRRVLGDVTISNGIQWSQDGTRVFYVDTPTQRIDVFDFDDADGSFHDRRPFAHVESDDGGPDGIVLDVDGGVWVAVFGGSQVRRYGPDGSLDEVIPLPTPQPTACTFGGPDLDRLFITTSSDGLQHPDPAAGALFTCAPGTSGLPPLPYAG